MKIIKKLANGIARTKFASKAINETVDLNAFKEKPSPKVILGIFLMVISYIMGWPMIGLFGVLSLYWNEPLMIIVGGPLLFVVAHLTFLAGLYIAGGKYIMPFIRLAIRVMLEKLI